MADVFDKILAMLEAEEATRVKALRTQIREVKEELADFTYAILKNKPVNVSVFDGLNAMEVAHQILEKVNR